MVWKKISKKQSVLCFVNKEKNIILQIDKKPFWATQEFGVELYIIQPWDRKWFKWFKSYQEALDYANKIMKEYSQ